MSNKAYVEPDYRMLFEQTQSLYMVLDPDLRVVAASDAYLKATLTSREDIIGRHVFEVFPGNPDDSSADAAVLKALASFKRVLQTGEPDVLGLQRHDVRKPGTEGGFEARYWNVVNSPVLNPDGSLAYILHRVENVTEFVLMKQKGVEQSKLTDELRERAVRMEADLTERKRAEEALRESEERYRSIFENSLDGIILSFPDGRILAANPEACRMHGYTEEEICRLGRNGIADTSDPRLSKLLEDRSRTGKHRGEVTHVRRDGTKFPCETSSVVFKDKHGREACVLIIRDITERKQAEEALSQAVERYERQVRLFDGVASTTPDFVYLFDPKGRFVYANRRLLEVWGMKLPDVIGKTCRELGYEQWHHDMHMGEIAKVIETKLPIKGEVPFRAPLTGIFGIYEYIFTPVFGRDGEVELIAGTTRDVTERKRAEEELRKAHGEMELRVKERTAELERKNQELQEFAFVASHDLNEPLRKIQTFGSLLTAKCADRLGEDQRDYISRMTSAADRMQKLLAALLNYSRIEMKAEEFRPTPLNDVVRDAISDMELEIRNAGVHVSVGPLSIARGDPSQLRQLFQNLVGNAIKYRRPEVTTVIRIYEERNDGECRVLVEDNGIGFDEKYLDKVFQPFQRLHGKSEYSGLGMGLAICRKIVDRHGGTIAAKSMPGKGSTFIVTLPMEGKQSEE